MNSVNNNKNSTNNSASASVTVTVQDPISLLHIHASKNHLTAPRFSPHESQRSDLLWFKDTVVFDGCVFAGETFMPTPKLAKKEAARVAVEQLKLQPIPTKSKTLIQTRPTDLSNLAKDARNFNPQQLNANTFRNTNTQQQQQSLRVESNAMTTANIVGTDIETNSFVNRVPNAGNYSSDATSSDANSNELALQCMMQAEEILKLNTALAESNSKFAKASMQIQRLEEKLTKKNQTIARLQTQAMDLNNHFNGHIIGYQQPRINLAPHAAPNPNPNPNNPNPDPNPNPNPPQPPNVNSRSYSSVSSSQPTPKSSPQQHHYHEQQPQRSYIDILTEAGLPPANLNRRFLRRGIRMFLSSFAVPVMLVPASGSASARCIAETVPRELEERFIAYMLEGSYLKALDSSDKATTTVTITAQKGNAGFFGNECRNGLASMDVRDTNTKNAVVDIDIDVDMTVVADTDTDTDAIMVDTTKNVDNDTAKTILNSAADVSTAAATATTKANVTNDLNIAQNSSTIASIDSDQELNKKRKWNSSETTSVVDVTDCNEPTLATVITKDSTPSKNSEKEVENRNLNLEKRLKDGNNPSTSAVQVDAHVLKLIEINPVTDAVVQDSESTASPSPVVSITVANEPIGIRYTTILCRMMPDFKNLSSDIRISIKQGVVAFLENENVDLAKYTTTTKGGNSTLMIPHALLDEFVDWIFGELTRLFPSSVVLRLE
ncbi:hypothetical protein HK100_003432 [Physocladia obscura]|uniref:DRBM domain-containing protein n=1 Tax=Physocladia obscura TaxID=109957 RepID=A0AAD5STZ8_9FUNG|nr:hypothetical protein HK100_003432 [Physocladia obscura]